MRRVPGQGSGISVAYWKMLSGDSEGVKPDRMILRFVERALGRKVFADDARRLLVESAERVSVEKAAVMSPRLLDYAIWAHERNRPAEAIAPAGSRERTVRGR